jgi:hypothetical protein
VLVPELTPRDPVAEPVARRRGSRYSAWSFGLLVLCGMPAVSAYLYRSWMLAAVTLGAVVLIFFVVYGSAGYWLGYARALRDPGVAAAAAGQEDADRR